MYKKDANGIIIRIRDNASIPAVDSNADYMDYLAWVAKGNVAPVDPNPVPGATELRFQAAKTSAKNIPNWATWSQQDWAMWRDLNVSATQINAIGNLTDAKAMLNKMSVVLDSLAKMEISLRDQVWPDLPNA